MKILKTNQVLIPIVLFLGLVLSGCGTLTGPSKLFQLVGKTATENIVLFEGTVSGQCRDLFAVPDASSPLSGTSNPERQTVGCLLPVRVDVERSDRMIFCPAGEFLAFCQEEVNPLSTRVSFKGIMSQGNGTIFFPETLKKKEL